MTPVERLVAAGIRPDCAAESVMWYQAQLMADTTQ